MNLKAIIAIILIALLTFTTLVYGLPWILKIATHGTIASELILTAEPFNIEWGIVSLNTSVSQLINITNVGTKNVTTLTMKYENASSNLLNYTLSWDCEAFDLPVGYYITANFTLTVYEAIEGKFTFDIWIGDNA